MSKPIAVITGDIHYNLQNLELADAATRMAIKTANELQVPFIANGDTTDQKALLRAECVNAMINTFKTAQVTPYINIGNHCKINAKSNAHALNFLAPYAIIVDEPSYFDKLGVYIIPYNDDIREIRKFLADILHGQILIMHQGLKSSNSGHYIQDHSALDPRDLIGFRTIMSHYHARQDIKCGDNVASLIGSPYTITFGEANDPEKGFHIIYDDGSLEFVPTNLRKHVVYNAKLDEAGINIGSGLNHTPDDLVWVKLSGTSDMLSKWPKDKIADDLCITQDFRLEITTTEKPPSEDIKQTQQETLDCVIDTWQNVDTDRKTRLKSLWKQLI